MRRLGLAGLSLLLYILDDSLDGHLFRHRLPRP